MIQPRSEDIERFAKAGYEAAQRYYFNRSKPYVSTAWEGIGQDNRDSWCEAARVIISHINIVEIEQRTVVFVPEIRFKE